MIKRELGKNIVEKLYKNKAVILLGARQVGKTTLLKNLVKDKEKVLWINADNIEDRELFENPSATRLKAVLSAYKISCILQLYLKAQHTL